MEPAYLDFEHGQLFGNHFLFGLQPFNFVIFIFLDILDVVDAIQRDPDQLLLPFATESVQLFFAFIGLSAHFSELCLEFLYVNLLCTELLTRGFGLFGEVV
jgi:hypothetical protein